MNEKKGRAFGHMLTDGREGQVAEEGKVLLLLCRACPAASAPGLAAGARQNEDTEALRGRAALGQVEDGEDGWWHCGSAATSRHGHGDEGGMDAAMWRRQRRSSSTSLDEGPAKRGRGWPWCRHGEGVVVHDSSWREIMAMVDGVDAAGLEQELRMVDAVEGR
jgi:hypothetical protein